MTQLHRIWHISVMASSTKLNAVQKGDRWIVQISWPNGTMHQLGRFASQEEAVGWIKEHEWMTAKKIDEAELARHRRRPS